MKLKFSILFNKLMPKKIFKNIMNFYSIKEKLFFYNFQ